ncbi:hypothetical protein D9611_001149 [Ephemerocybe angulata]|uniref:Uncharacterized protein n=1 Tax=Ephemerocybe angulata TaxID=980116 RepID=A0A8H5CIA1_9AGAR|nr:hypothetical protein D9611_001149 [Tulosesus angulatus]
MAEGPIQRFNNGVQKAFGRLGKPDYRTAAEPSSSRNTYIVEAGVLKLEKDFCFQGKGSATTYATAKEMAASRAYENLCSAFPELNL